MGSYFVNEPNLNYPYENNKNPAEYILSIVECKNDSIKLAKRLADIFLESNFAMDIKKFSDSSSRNSNSNLSSNDSINNSSLDEDISLLLNVRDQRSQKNIYTNNKNVIM